MRISRKRSKPVEIDINALARELLVQARKSAKHKKAGEEAKVVISKQYSEVNHEELVSRIRELESLYGLVFLRRHSGNTLVFTKN